jgi:hypothetical protein
MTIWMCKLIVKSQLLKENIEYVKNIHPKNEKKREK